MISEKKGQVIISATFDHKPQFFNEMSRIFEKGGQIYRMSSCRRTGKNQIYIARNHNEFSELDQQQETQKDKQFGPWRVRPGGLSVTLYF